MSAPDPSRPRVVHLDHTASAGGAELSLVRMLRAGPDWNPLLLTPPDARDGVFAALRGTVPHRVSGVAQPTRVSSARRTALVAAALRLGVQAVATRIHPAFRSADVIDANSSRAAAYGALAAGTSRVPFVVHLRDMVTPEALGSSGYATMTRLALPRADAVVANSAATLASARPYLDSSTEAVVIPSAAGLVTGRSRPARDAGAPLRIGMLARIDPWKGQAALIDAFAVAFGQRDALLELAGGAPFGHEGHADQLRRRADAAGLGDRVRFLGHVDDVDVLLETWDIAVQFSSRPEPLGQNVLQYLAAGCAVIVADEGGPAEWVRSEENGLAVPPRDGDALAAALTRLAADSALRERLGRAAAATPGLLDDAQVANAHAELYRSLAGRGRHGRRRPRSQ